MSFLIVLQSKSDNLTYSQPSGACLQNEVHFLSIRSMTSLMESRSRFTFALLVSWVIYSVFFRFSKVSTNSLCRTFRSAKSLIFTPLILNQERQQHSHSHFPTVQPRKQSPIDKVRDDLNSVYVCQ